MIQLISVGPSRKKGAKLVATFSNGREVHFGCAGYGDYIQYYATKGKEVAARHRNAYIRRHQSREDWRDPQARGTLSRFILWEEPTVEEAARKYHQSIRSYSRHRQMTK